MKKFQKEIDKYLEERNWKKHASPDYLAKSILLEAAELLEIFQRNNWTKDEILKNPDLFESVKDELGDVIILSVELANLLDLDFIETAHAKFEKVKKKYPADIIKGNSEAYLEIKKQHRAQK